MAFFIESVVFLTMAIMVFVLALDQVWDRIFPGGTAMVKERELSDSLAVSKGEPESSDSVAK